MRFHFYKYQSTGNDFVIFDNREGKVVLTKEQVAALCHRRFGIGGDGLMLLNSHSQYHFEMKYYNADGAEGTMCGNGGRSLVKFAAEMGIFESEYRFLAIDGEHEARIEAGGNVALKMIDVKSVTQQNKDYVLNTGSPHYIKATGNVAGLDVYTEGQAIRYSDEYRAEGINVNFVQPTEIPESIIVRTYERGVEDETFSCGTGVTAPPSFAPTNMATTASTFKQKGGGLAVEFDKTENGYENIWLIGPAEKVFEGEIEISDF